MKIASVSAHSVGISFKPAYQNDRRFYPKPPVQLNTIVVVKSDSGHVGYGEAAHAPGVYGETAQATEGAIAYFEPHLVGQNPLELTALEVLVDRLSPIGNIAAKAALDTALHDLAGRILGVPLYQLLGGRVHESLPTHISPATYEHTDEDLDALRREGYRFFKQKMSGDTDYDLALVRKLLPLCAEDVTLSLDANQGWTLNQARWMAEHIEADPNFRHNVILEQPIHAADVRGMAHLRDHTPIPVMADDGIRTDADLLAIIEQGAADILSLKISRVGGIRKCARMIAVAEAHHIDYIVDEITEMRVANTAVAHLAIASKRPLYTGVTCHLLLESDVVAAGGVEVRDGHAWIGDEPGLGITALDLPQAQEG